MISDRFISLVIPTRNRENRLEKLLTELVTQSLPSQFWEVIVVNNASSDNTQ
ncbi:MAG: glycosyltransferase, partial [Proteobacteria bacterium]|nr:glycosyltransferase [Pseudomonadota bacterium]